MGTAGVLYLTPRDATATVIPIQLHGLSISNPPAGGAGVERAKRFPIIAPSNSRDYCQKRQRRVSVAARYPQGLTPIGEEQGPLRRIP